MSYNPFTLKGKTILITGASSGIGRATAIECSKLGATCIITARNEKRLNETLSQLEGEGHKVIIADIAVQDGIDILVEQIPNIDGLVNNAGIGLTKPLAFCKQKDLENIFQVNTFSPLLIVKSIFRKNKFNSFASIVFVASAGTYTVLYGNGIYSASKASLTTFMHHCAKEFSKNHIRANAVQPGMIDTPLIHDGSISEEDLKNDMQKYPMGRYGKPEEIAYAIIYLLSDAAVWTTGASINVDGGLALV